MMQFSRNTSIILASLLLTACVSTLPRQPANVIHDNAHSGGNTLAFSNNSTIAASGGWSGYIRLWRMPEGTHIQRWKAHTSSVNSIVFLEGDSRLISGGYDRRIVEWDLQGNEIRSIVTPSSIRHLIVNEKDNLILTGHQDGVARQWRLSDFTLMAKTARHGNAIRAVAAHNTSNWMASGGEDGAVWIWNGSKEPQRLPNPGSYVRTLTFSPDGKHLYGGSWFNIYRWDIPGGKMQTLKTEHTGIINDIQFGPKGDYLATISRQTDSAVLFINPENGEAIRRFQKHDLCGGAVAVSPDGRYLSTTSDDASVRFYNLDDKQNTD
jgi:WD40 repeat protein